jgi:hypothetical protein
MSTQHSHPHHHDPATPGATTCPELCPQCDSPCLGAPPRYARFLHMCRDLHQWPVGAIAALAAWLSDPNPFRLF